MPAGPEPSYLGLDESGELAERAAAAREMLSRCRLCPRECGVNRLDGETGFCGGGEEALVGSVSAHFGEERPLVGVGGSGTIFLAGCNLGCLFCQNYELSHLGMGREVGRGELANMMLQLQRAGCHNINFVTPTHFMPQILAALGAAIERGLTVPLVYNCGGYESLEALKLLDGVVDIYMPDAKYSNSAAAEELSGAPDYPERMRAAIAEMHRQVGDLVISDEGLAVRGLLVRHLVLPEDLAGTAEVMRFLASLSRDTYVNVMAQYRPCFRANEHPPMDRRITMQEYREAVQLALDAGLHRLDERPLAWLR